MLSDLQHIEKAIISQLFGVTAPLSGLDRILQILFGLSLVFLVVGSAFIIYGVNSWLSVQYNKDIAAIITGFISLVISGVFVTLLITFNCVHKNRISKYQIKSADLIKSFLSNLEKELADPISENPKTALMLATLFGFLIKDNFSNNSRM
jgi:cytochrome c biogenesis protein CcdA